MLLGSDAPTGSFISCMSQAMTNLICGSTLWWVLRQSWFPAIQDSLHIASSTHRSPSHAGPSSCEISLSSSSGNWSCLKTHAQNPKGYRASSGWGLGKVQWGKKHSKSILSSSPFCHGHRCHSSVLNFGTFWEVSGCVKHSEGYGAWQVRLDPAIKLSLN